MGSPIKRFWGRFRRDSRGASAVEFALLAPVMILLYFATAEYCQAFMAQRKASHVAATIGDLVAQNETTTDAQLDDIFAISKMLVAPFPDSQLKMCVASITLNATTKEAIVDWGRAYKSGTCVNKGDKFTQLPTNASDKTKPFINPGESVILSRIFFTYSSPVKYMINSDIVFTETFYLRPRKSNVVTKN